MSTSVLLLLFVSALSDALIIQPRASFSNFHVLEVTPDSEAELAVLLQMESTAGQATEGALEFWKGPTRVNASCTLSVHPELVVGVLQFFDERNMTHSILVTDLQALIDEETESLLKNHDGLSFRDPGVSHYDEGSYNRLNQVTMHLQELQTSNSGLMEVSTIGTTSEGRPIQMAKVALKDSRRRPSIWLECGIHAREWISPSFCMFTLKRLLEEGATGMASKFDFHFIPVANPDGYEYTWNSDRMWRKNRRVTTGAGKSAETFEPEVEDVLLKQIWGTIPGFGSWNVPQGPQIPQFPQGQQVAQFPQGPQAPQVPQAPQGAQGFPSSKCLGVDPNRNFDTGFGGFGSSPRACEETFHGPFAFSEAESAALRDAVRQAQAGGQTVAAYLSVHSYSQLWMLPNGYVKTPAHDHADLMRVARVATDALRAVYGTSYTYGPIWEVIFQAGGSTIDWMYSVAKVKYSYALELRDTGRHAFILPVDQIEPTNKETFAGLKAMVAELEKEYPVA